jgi:hypothetical protein
MGYERERRVAKYARTLLSLSVMGLGRERHLALDFAVGELPNGTGDLSAYLVLVGRSFQTYPDTASSSGTVPLASLNACGTGAPACGLLLLFMISWALMFLLFPLLRSYWIVTLAGRLNCE